jgi:hypothetical protein
MRIRLTAPDGHRSEVLLAHRGVVTILEEKLACSSGGELPRSGTEP